MIRIQADHGQPHKGTCRENAVQGAHDGSCRMKAMSVSRNISVQGTHCQPSGARQAASQQGHHIINKLHAHHAKPLSPCALCGAQGRSLQGKALPRCNMLRPMLSHRVL